VLISPATRTFHQWRADDGERHKAAITVSGETTDIDGEKPFWSGIFLHNSEATLKHRRILTVDNDDVTYVAR